MEEASCAASREACRRAMAYQYHYAEHKQCGAGRSGTHCDLGGGRTLALQRAVLDVGGELQGG